jgi:hypothetical protein
LNNPVADTLPIPEDRSRIVTSLGDAPAGRRSVTAGATLAGVPVDAGSYHYVVGPVVAAVVVCLLAVVMRWIFGSGRSRGAATGAPVAGPADHGLLRPVAELPDRAAGSALRAVLSDAGIRSTLGVCRDGRVQVLVFADDEDRARRLVPPTG